MSELMKNSEARAIFAREFPGVIGSPAFNLAQGMSLNQVLGMVKGMAPAGKIDSVLSQLKAL